MNATLCIHGHFYQPPRENPWLGLIPSESSAAPMQDWNERILRESYAPLAWARRIDSDGKIFDITNCYEWLSFNVGPTLMHWLRRNSPETVERMLEGDVKSLTRTGHGNAIAQVYHHVIMPLATAEDRELEICWAIDDFRHTFGREPEGMWLSEAAVDTASLESLAAHGISFVILAPRQAKAIIKDGKENPVDESSLYIGEPYIVNLPSGKKITAVFYDGGLSRAIAFESMLRDGEQFWQRLSREANSLGGEAPLLTISTDGETYGHHFKFGEMALAHVLAQAASGRDGVSITNIPAYIAAHPPRHQVILHEPSSWSCVHGIERWRSDCGCTDGGHQGWNQKWRGPLRNALEIMRKNVNEHFHSEGQKYFLNTRQTLIEYGKVLADQTNKDNFTAKYFRSECSQPGSVEYDNAWKMLYAQEQSLAAFASCAWFFDDISRIEPENGLTFALRAIELSVETGGSDPRQEMLEELDKAFSNRPEKGSGKDLFLNEVANRQLSLADICLMAVLLMKTRGDIFRERLWGRYEWPSVMLRIAPSEIKNNRMSGKAVIRSGLEFKGKECEWELELPGTTTASDNQFVSLADAKLTLKRGDHVESSTPGKFSRPIMDYLTTSLSELKEKAMRPVMLAQAKHFISMTTPWPEEQSGLIKPELYYALMPYVLVACVMDDSIPPENLEQLKGILAKYLDVPGKYLAATVLREEMEELLPNWLEDADGMQSAVNEGQLAAIVGRIKELSQETDLWTLQNMVWAAGAKTLPLLSEALKIRA